MRLEVKTCNGEGLIHRNLENVKEHQNGVIELIKKGKTVRKYHRSNLVWWKVEE